MASCCSVLLTIVFIFTIIASVTRVSSSTRNFTIVNSCKETIWLGITHSENISGGGFELKPQKSTVYTASSGWGGRIWARTSCKFNKNGNGTCQTGSCGSTLNCTGPSSPPTSIAEFNLGEIDYYDVSLVDGFNLPVIVKAFNGTGNCSTAGCDGDLRQNCPSDLTLKAKGKVIACRSACDVYKTDEYCCRGKYGNPDTCLPSNYSKSFKQVCPAAYSYAYDDPTSIITCSGANYVVAFCASRNQTVCSYHDNQLFCNQSKGLKVVPHRWWVAVLAIPLMLKLCVMF
ncbi:pathogenesis-related thaumatin-like protein 3.5 isoform X2 [Quercus suber]|uniref:pathogenesis-related thaumatin-like protein 3.5 isoform X2 n=1 Tax=Quercus suber TaxID=58331 RepID=UPI000CE235CC|nr:pathogenesis-related protein 5-like [Quercus suber]